MKQEVAEALLRWEDHPEVDQYEEVVAEEVTGTSRWSTFYRSVYRHAGSGTFWEVTWSRGSTEYQDEGAEDIAVREVRAVQKTVTVYE